VQLFTELAKAYVDSLEPDSMAPRQQPTGVLASLLRLLEALLPLVGEACGARSNVVLHLCTLSLATLGPATADTQ
jgi:hypothetical protein